MAKAVTLHSVPETQVLLGGLGKTTLYDLVGKGELETVHIGRRMFIPSDSVQDFIERRRAAADQIAREREGLSQTVGALAESTKAGSAA